MMGYGYTGKILRVHLDTRTYSIEEKEEEFYRKYMGGRNIALYYLIREVPSHVDPFEAQNKIVFSTSILTGTSIPGSSRYTVATKSPLTGKFGESQAGGWWGPELKFAGFDALIVEGKSERPVYLWIHGMNIEFCDATHLWGKTTGEVQDIIKKEVNDEKSRVLQCGPAGERLIRYACITNELAHFNGRCGIGAVMGSKRLRAIVVKGNTKNKIKDKQRIKEFVKWFSMNVGDHPGLKVNMELGTAKGVVPMSESGMLPTYNFKTGYFKDADNISGEKVKEVLLKKRDTCYACPIRCKRVVEYSDRQIKIESQYGGPEFESIGLLGSCCGIDDIVVVCKANEMCAKYGLDTISTGATIAFAMECYEKGLLKKEELDGLDLSFGNKEAYLLLLDLIINREGIGDLLAEGSFRAAKKIGKGAFKYSMSVKGQELPAHEPRGKWGVALGYAISPTGADHLQAAHDPWFDREPDPDIRLNFIDISDMNEYGLTEPQTSMSLGPEKIRLFVYLQFLWSLHDVLDLCIFVSVPEYRMMTISQLIELIQAVTGWNTGVWELLKVGERGITMARSFNILHGLKPEDDTLPDRMFQPLSSGALAGVKIDRNIFTDGVKLYYEAMGWDYKQGIPTRGKLAELGIYWVNDYIKIFRC